MQDNQLIDKIKQIVYAQFETDATGHDWYHIDRVYQMAIHLQSKEGGDLFLIQLGALLHDISDHKFNGGSATLGGETAYNLLIENGLDKERAFKVKLIVNQISYKGANVLDETNSIESKIVQDADRLDAIGAIGIARAFAYGGNKNRPIYDPSFPPILHTTFEEYKNAKSHTINHFYEKLLLLTNKLHTSSAKEIGKHRHQYLEQFLNEFMSEWNFKSN